MSSQNPLDRLRNVKEKADSTDSDRRNYARFISDMGEFGKWSEEDVSWYADQIKTLMSGDDSAAMALFPAGIYQSANEAREGARNFWKSRVGK